METLIPGKLYKIDSASTYKHRIFSQPYRTRVERGVEVGYVLDNEPFMLVRVYGNVRAAQTLEVLTRNCCGFLTLFEDLEIITEAVECES